MLHEKLWVVIKEDFLMRLNKSMKKFMIFSHRPIRYFRKTPRLPSLTSSPSSCSEKEHSEKYTSSKILSTSREIKRRRRRSITSIMPWKLFKRVKLRINKYYRVSCKTKRKFCWSITIHSLWIPIMYLKIAEGSSLSWALWSMVILP